MALFHLGSPIAQNKQIDTYLYSREWNWQFTLFSCMITFQSNDICSNAFHTPIIMEGVFSTVWYRMWSLLIFHLIWILWFRGSLFALQFKWNLLLFNLNSKRLLGENLLNNSLSFLLSLFFFIFLSICFSPWLNMCIDMNGHTWGDQTAPESPEFSTFFQNSGETSTLARKYKLVKEIRKVQQNLKNSDWIFSRFRKIHTKSWTLMESLWNC